MRQPTSVVTGPERVRAVKAGSIPQLQLKLISDRLVKKVKEHQSAAVQPVSESAEVEESDADYEPPLQQKPAEFKRTPQRTVVTRSTGKGGSAAKKRKQPPGSAAAPRSGKKARHSEKENRQIDFNEPMQTGKVLKLQLSV